MTGLGKRYGVIRAIEDVNFTVNRGEVVGLLGPNGAGKTTTMRILAGCLGATAGKAQVEGLDVTAHPKEVKRRIGYLPESPPLYKSMIVWDYVAFAAAIKGVKDIHGATERALSQVGLLEDVGDRPAAERIIGNLSKGFQQRVGLAQALVHDPDVLVLDEPTSGLDPAQRKEIRVLLQRLAHESRRTIILSTHVLADVEDICSRVVVLDKGTVVAEDSITSLRRQGGRVRLVVAQPSSAAAEALRAVAGVRALERHEDGAYTLTVSQECRADLAAAAVPFGLLELGHQAESLEEIFLKMTGGEE